MTKPLIIDYYTDMLCVWAWIAQRRVDELNANLGDKIEIHHYYVDVFGDVENKMETGWKTQGGYAGFAAHVTESAEKFDDAQINPEIWTQVRPTSSGNAHLVLKAVELAHGRQHSIDVALMLRRSFFCDAQDIGRLDVMYDLVRNHGLDPDPVSNCIQDGRAMAALLGDYQKAKQNNIVGSPSYVIDGGRQILFGNVGYRVIHTNIEEHLKHPREEASWC